MHDGKTIYRVTVDGLHCRSSRELINLSFAKVPGVEATAIDDRDVLTVFADATAVRPSDVVRTLIATGFVPADEVRIAEPVVAETVLAEEPVIETAEVAEEPAIVEVEVAEEPVIAEVEVAEEPAVVEVQMAEVAVEPAHGFIEPAHALVETVAETPADAAAERAPAAVAVATHESSAGDDGSAWSPQEAYEAPVTHASPQASLVQRIRVEVSDNYYPNRIDVIPGVPVEIEFGEGHGCLARVLFEDFGIEQDLTQGGGIVRLPGLTPGEYRFSCGMRMVFGKVVAQS